MTFFSVNFHPKRASFGLNELKPMTYKVYMDHNVLSSRVSWAYDLYIVSNEPIGFETTINTRLYQLSIYRVLLDEFTVDEIKASKGELVIVDNLLDDHRDILSKLGLIAV